MPMIIKQDCPCCFDRRIRGRGDNWHCEYCWNTYHHGKRDKDFLTHDEFRKRKGGR